VGRVVECRSGVFRPAWGCGGRPEYALASLIQPGELARNDRQWARRDVASHFYRSLRRAVHVHARVERHHVVKGREGARGGRRRCRDGIGRGATGM
jgi:hypothetical protein